MGEPGDGAAYAHLTAEQHLAPCADRLCALRVVEEAADGTNPSQRRSKTRPTRLVRCGATPLPTRPSRSRIVYVSSDPFDLERFVAAQRHSYDSARAELAAGHKTSHWMWFVFPQIAGLGFSQMSVRYAIGSREEAVAYLQHPLLGPRLFECTRLVVDTESRTAEQIFGGIDALKFRSCMTLFASVAPEQALFDAAIRKYFGGQADANTLARL
jgi:uncharacterized protein (DUF1810 family)